MQRVRLGHSQRPSLASPPRWRERYDRPSEACEIEADIGDRSVWRGIRYMPEIEAFVDAEFGAAVSVVMWRYAG